MSVRLFDLYGVRASALAADPPAPSITSIEEGDQQLVVHFFYDDSAFPITDIEYSLDGGGWVASGISADPVTISGLTNGQTYSVQIRIVSGSSVSDPSSSETGTPATVPDAPTIDSINSGDGEMFIYYTLGFDGGSPITGLQYRLDGGSWSSTIPADEPLVANAANEDTYDVEIRAINSLGPSGTSNIVTGKAEQEPELQRYFTIDTDLFSQVDNLTFTTVKLGNQVILHHSNDETDTPDEPWERLDSNPPEINNPQAAQARGSIRGLTVDHEGHLRCYYTLVFQYEDSDGDEQRKNALAVQRSKDGGSTWSKMKVNLNTDLLAHENSNLIDFPAPAGFEDYELSTVKIIYDPSEELYIALSTYGNDYYISTSADGLTFNTPQMVLSSIPGDDVPGSLFKDTNENEWVIAFRGRENRPGYPPSFEPDHPAPYYYSRFLSIAKTDPGDDYDDSYSIVDDGSGNPKIIVDPAIIYNYDGEADQSSFWELVDTGDDCPNNSEHYEPAPGETARIRPDFQVAPIIFYAGQYFSIPSVYFRDDNRSPYNNRDRTDGPTYPVWGYSRVREGYSIDEHGGTVEGGWKFPDKNRPAINIFSYSRVDDHPCNLSGEADEVGRISSGVFVVHPGTNRLIVAANIATDLEEQRSFGTNTNIPLEFTVATHWVEEDRFAKLTAGGTEGYWRTSKLRVPDGATSLLINSDGDVYVELLNVITNTPIAGFTKADTKNKITADETDNQATWSSHSIDELARQNVRLKIYVTNGSVYSFRFE